MKTERLELDGLGLVAAREAAAGEGEDGFAADTDAAGGLLCVADGCGGSGAARYPALGGVTEARCASRIAVECARDWAGASGVPASPAEARAAADSLALCLRERLAAFHARNRESGAGPKIVMRGLSRTLPTTLCLARIDARAPDSVSCAFFWAGDSRGYVLFPDGLSQCTADHSAGCPDALESLTRDARLSNVVCADEPFHIEAAGLTLPKPCAVLTATDGAFGYLPTPMEFELLLLKTLEASASPRSWRLRIGNALARTAGDDATVALACFGVRDFLEFKKCFASRRAAFQAENVTPVRRRMRDPGVALDIWEKYRRRYEAFGEGGYADWRV